MAKRTAMFLISTILTGSAAVTAASAAEPAEQLTADDSEAVSGHQVNEIMVTAQRKSESLQKVPISIVAATAEELVKSGVQSTADLPFITPGLNYTRGIGFGYPYLRGIGSSGNGPGQENSVAVYVDGVYIATKLSGTTDLANIERVEVLKGPQGTLFGRNATGGLIQVVTVTPPSSPEMMVRLGYDSYETATASGYIGAPLSDSVRADFAANYQYQGQGWGKNIVTGKDVNLEKKFSARTKLEADLGDLTTATLAADYVYRNSSIGATYRYLDGAVGFEGFVFPEDGGPYDIASAYDPRITGKAGGTSLTVRHEADFADIVSISAWRKSKYYIEVDNNLNGEPSAAGLADNKERQFSQEFQLLGSNDSGLDWTVGLYGFWYKGNQVIDLVGEARASEFWVNGRQSAESYAIYGQVTQELWDGGRLTGGLRQTWEDRTLEGQFSFGEPIEKQKASFSKLSWRLALDQDIGPDALIYASYNRGFKSGAFNAGFLQQTPVKPEVLDALEVGLKSSLFDKTMRFNLAAFYYDFKDIQLQQFINGVGGLRNAAKAEIYGFDAEVEFAITDRLNLGGNLAWAKGTFKSFPGSNVAVPNVDDDEMPTGGNTIITDDVTGNDIPRLPRLTATVNANYILPVGDTEGLEFNVTYSYNDGFYVEPDNYLRQDAYSLINVRADLHINENLTIGAWVRNLTDKFYTTALTAQAAGDAYVPAEPRVIGAAIEVRF